MNNLIMADGKPAKICSLKNAYVDKAATILAKVGDRVACLHWDDGEPDAIVWHHTDHPMLNAEEDGTRFLDLSGKMSLPTNTSRPTALQSAD